MLVWAFDEAHTFQQPSAPSPLARHEGEATWISMLLSEFARFRMSMAAQDVMPLCVVASTLWSATELISGGSNIVDLQLLPLSVDQSSALFKEVCERLPGSALVDMQHSSQHQ